MDITICPFCLTIFLYTQDEGSECPSCEIGILEDFDEYEQRRKHIEETDERSKNDTSIAS